MYLPKPKEREGKVTLKAKDQRAQLLRKITEQHGLCYWCKVPLGAGLRYPTRDHVQPQPAGCAKDDRDSNVVAACWSCNFQKGSKRP